MINDKITKLEDKLGGQWLAIKQSYSDAKAKELEISKLLKQLTSQDGTKEEEASVVVFGSLARREWTQGSDVDWTFLIDGRASHEHRSAAHKIKVILDENDLKEPGQGGVFGNLAFSHDIVHQIGGQNDTNHNTTQRILLLTESRCIGNDDAYRRVTKAVLDRYIEDDISFVTSLQKIPRFLLNDIVRYWRTVAVDYAHKVYDRGGKGWALRNIKLRFSRKLIFVAGLLTCFSCKLKPSKFIEEVSGECSEIQRLGLINHIDGYIQKTPLEILVEFLDEYADDATAVKIMNNYNSFVELLSDKEKRNKLASLKLEEKDDPLFLAACDKGRDFQDGLQKFFFEGNDELKKLTQEYGVF